MQVNQRKTGVTIGIPAYNEEANIEYLVRDIAWQKLRQVSLEKIIVVSDGSTDNTVTTLKKIQNPILHVIDNQIRNGQANAENQIIQNCSSAILILLNADILIRDELFIEKLVNPIISGGIDLASARVQELAPITFIQKILDASMKFKKQVFEQYKSGNHIYTCHGRARAFSCRLYKNLIFDQSVGEDAYSYLFCKYHRYRYQFVGNTEVFYQLPRSFSDHEKQSQRFYESKNIFTHEFGNDFVKQEYYLPKIIFLKSFVKFFIKTPIILLYFVIAVTLRIKALFISKSNPLFDVSVSTKKLEARPAAKKLTVCFFGAYDKTYTSNLIVMHGLKENGVEIVEVNSNIKVTRLDSKKDMGWWPLIKRIIRKYKLIPEIFQHLDDIGKSDVIYIGYPGHFEVLPAFIIGKIFQKKIFFFPVIVFYTGFVDDQDILKKNSFLGRIIKFGEKLIYNMVDVVLPDTPLQKQHLINLFNLPENKLKVLPIGADSRAYKYTPYLNKEKRITCTYYGLYTPLHGVEHVIEAARILRDNSDIKFTFVGNGKTFQENYDRAKKLGLTNVEFFYNTPESEHAAILEKADLFFGFLQDHPTVTRVIPNKVYQGLALGKVVVTADSPVARSVFTHNENVCLVAPSNPKDLAEKILELKNNPHLRKQIAESGYQLYQQKFTPIAIGKTLIKYIEEVL